MASRRKITKQKRRNKKAKLIVKHMHICGIKVNRNTKKELRMR